MKLSSFLVIMIWLAFGLWTQGEWDFGESTVADS